MTSMEKRFAVSWLAALALGSGVARAQPAGPARTHAETMAAMGLVRHDGAWRTPQEIELLGRAERDAAARRDWTKKLDRLRKGLERGDAAAAEIRGISDPLAVSALVAALAADPDRRARGLYVEALSRIPSGEAAAALVATALDHVDDETRFAAVERLAALGPGLAAPAFVAALASPDNARVNRAAEALGRLGESAAVLAPLIGSLETRHVVVQGDGTAAGSTTATFTPSGGGLSMGSGPKRVTVTARNDRVLEALVALTGQNFAWDAAAWRRWLAACECPEFDPRRAP